MTDEFDWDADAEYDLAMSRELERSHDQWAESEYAKVTKNERIRQLRHEAQLADDAFSAILCRVYGPEGKRVQRYWPEWRHLDNEVRRLSDAKVKADEAYLAAVRGES